MALKAPFNSPVVSKPSTTSILMAKCVSKLIECPICYDSMLNKILICNNGHSICDACYERLNLPKTCPSCKEKYLCCNKRVNRNLALEHLIFNTVLPCKYSHNGCTELLCGEERKQHLKTCKQKPINCPFSVAILPVFNECLYSTNNLEKLIEHVSKHHHFDIFQNKNNHFQFQLDDITDGCGHYRIVLKSMKPRIECLLIGFKSQSGSIALFCRSLQNKDNNMDYKIVATFPNNMNSEITFKSKMYGPEEEIGKEFRTGLVLKLSKEQVKMWQIGKINEKPLKPNSVPLTVIIGNDLIL